MDFETLRTTTLDVVRDHQAWAPVITGIIAFCESLAVLSIFVPATVILLGIGALLGAGDIPFVPVMVGAAIGAILGDWVSYEFGRYYKDGAKRIWPLTRYPEMVTKGEDFCRRWGAWGIFVGRFIGPARAVVPLIAGIFLVGRLPFQVANVTSAFVWAFVWLAPGAGVFGFLRA
ncbi:MULTISPECIES: DedA family protein [Methylobacterium]|jgi:membrane protein DedA with SNARE-associated domain|uniref:Inner membrane protein YabI n=1 Tax=Methylobacterium isbiliense TaxID=315478 RepID=A0ABQ4SB18_9HYPH|nr:MULTISPECIES: DedA family protein [Methylobacterium]MBY0295916.1 DedA family protein [Methylobacterium sp.]MDN3625184.1 DedA family protein [Methylobacterium isbiliense]GJE00402.1 Inner membrane protein YabI [Methylobacterium isbiliense]